MYTVVDSTESSVNKVVLKDLDLSCSFWEHEITYRFNPFVY